MSKRVTQSYSPEFRAEAIKLVLEQGFSAVEAAARLKMNQGTLAYWVTQASRLQWGLLRSRTRLAATFSLHLPRHFLTSTQ